MGEQIGIGLIEEIRHRPAKPDSDGQRKGRVLALYGELGSGKTTFVQGLAKGLGLPDRMVSPTFIIIKKYGLKNLPWSSFYHIDCYRLEPDADLVNLGFSEIFSNPRSVVIIEWAEKVEQLLPKDTTKIYFKIIDENQRQIVIKE